MSYSYTTTESRTFTLTHARHMGLKVATDLKRMQRLYGKPSEISIDKFEREVIALLHAGYLGSVTYGFKRDGEWIEPTVSYTANDLFAGTTDDDPGRIRPGQDIEGATFGSYLTYSKKWKKLSSAEQELFEKDLPIQRTGADEPTVSANSYLMNDKTYSAGGRSLSRSSVRNYI